MSVSPTSRVSKNADASDDFIRNWLRNRNTVEFLGIWERLHNPGFKPIEFDWFKMQALDFPHSGPLLKLSL